MNDENSLNPKKNKKNSSINLIIGVVLLLLICVGGGFIYASLQNSQNDGNKNDDLKNENKIEKVDWIQKSKNTQRKVDEILLTQSTWQLAETKNNIKNADYLKNKKITWSQRDILVGVSSDMNLEDSTIWFENTVRDNGFKILKKRETIYKAQKAYEINVAMSNDLDGEFLDCVTDKILFYTVSKTDRPIIIKEPNTNDSTIAGVVDNKSAKGAFAIIVDDCGYSDEVVREFSALPIKLSFSIIPFLPESKSNLDIIIANKKEALVHLPMEPFNKSVATFKEMITVDMTKEQCQKYVKKAVESLPGIVGANNHQGSKATSNKYTMLAVTEVLKDNNLYFVDSRTYSKSKAYQVAKEVGLKSAKNRMFLDNSSNVEDIKEQIKKAVKFTEKGEDVIVICHARPNSYKALKEIYPSLEKEGIGFKFVSEVVK